MVDMAAAVGSFFRLIRDAGLSVLAQIENSNDIDEDIDGILQVQQEKHPHSILHAVAFY